MTAQERLLGEIAREPWRFWSTRAKESVARIIAIDIAHMKDQLQDYPWSAYPTTRSDLEDTIRALTDLWSSVMSRADQVEEEMPTSETLAVGMGEEPAP